MKKRRSMHWAIITLGALAALLVIITLVGYALPKGHLATRTARFNAPPQAVWDIITDYPNHPSWRTGLKAVERLPDRDGHPVWQEISTRAEKLPVETVESDPPRRLVGKIADPKLPFGGTWTYELAPDGPAGTRLTITERGEVYNPIFRLVSRFMDPGATIDRYLADLARKLG